MTQLSNRVLMKIDNPSSSDYSNNKKLQNKFSKTTTNELLKINKEQKLSQTTLLYSTHENYYHVGETFFSLTVVQKVKLLFFLKMRLKKRHLSYAAYTMCIFFEAECRFLSRINPSHEVADWLIVEKYTTWLGARTAVHCQWKIE